MPCFIFLRAFLPGGDTSVLLCVNEAFGALDSLRVVILLNCRTDAVPGADAGFSFSVLAAWFLLKLPGSC